jgi:site-specific recombinase XerD
LVIPTTQTVAVRHPDESLMHLAAAFLLSKKPGNTRSSYANDLGLRFRGDTLEWRPDGKGFLPYLTQIDVALFSARRQHIEAWVETCRREGLSDQTVNRRLSTVTGLYRYCLREELTDHNPMAYVERASVDPMFSPTFGPDLDQARAITRVAQEEGVRPAAIVGLLLYCGLRVSEVVGLAVEDLTVERGHRVVRVMGKGRKPAYVPLAPPAAAAVDAYLAERPGDGVMFAGARGGILTRQKVFALVKRIGRKAALPRELTPHCLRHAYITLALDAGVPLRDVQDSARHARADTTRRYDHNRGLLERNAGYRLAEYLAGDA